MADTDDNVVPHERVRSLREAVQAARIADADRSDALEQRRQTELVRLDLAARELEQVFADAAAKSDQFVFEISTGATPRLWIDATSHVVMAHNIHTYRFLKDTRLGRIVLSETDVLDELADRVTAYIAERIVDQERAVEADWQIWRLNEQARKEAADAAARADNATAAKDAEEEAPAAPVAPRRAGGMLTTFILGLILGGVALAGYLQYAGIHDFRAHFAALRGAATSAFPTLKAGTEDAAPAAEGQTGEGQAPTAAPSTDGGASPTATPAE